MSKVAPKINKPMKATSNVVTFIPQLSVAPVSMHAKQNTPHVY